MRRKKRKIAKARRRLHPAKVQPASGNAALLATGKRLGDAFRKADKAEVAKLTDVQYRFIDAAGKEHSKAEVLRHLKAPVPGGAERIVKVKDYGCVATITTTRKSAGEPDVFALDGRNRKPSATSSLRSSSSKKPLPATMPMNGSSTWPMNSLSRAPSSIPPARPSARHSCAGSRPSMPKLSSPRSPG
jgi:hypothetical protein